MKLQAAPATRSAYYDRNPLIVVQSLNVNGAAPHGSTTRWTYTVPTGRKAFIETAASEIHTVTAAAPNGRRTAHHRITHSTTEVAVRNASYNNVVDGQSQVNATSVGLISAGDVFDWTTSDSSTGGTNDYSGDAKYTEFDA